jgi:hypothetical protein
MYCCLYLAEDEIFTLRNKLVGKNKTEFKRLTNFSPHVWFPEPSIY